MLTLNSTKPQSLYNLPVHKEGFRVLQGGGTSGEYKGAIRELEKGGYKGGV